MLTRAIITAVDLNSSKVQIRIPWLEGIENSENSPTSNQDLTWASILCIPGIEIDYQPGDIVVVGFEDNNIGRPIVIGFLKLIGKEIDTKLYCKMKELEVQDSLIAPSNTTIGRSDYQDIFNAIESDSGEENP